MEFICAYRSLTNTNNPRLFLSLRQIKQVSQGKGRPLTIKKACGPQITRTGTVRLEAS